MDKPVEQFELLALHISHNEKRAEIRLAHDLTGVGRESMCAVS